MHLWSPFTSKWEMDGYSFNRFWARKHKRFHYLRTQFRVYLNKNWNRFPQVLRCASRCSVSRYCSAPMSMSAERKETGSFDVEYRRVEVGNIRQYSGDQFVFPCLKRLFSRGAVENFGSRTRNDHIAARAR